MATFALKVSIDDSKYVIRGIDKESSKKEILCILTKHKSKDQLPELQSALSKLNGSVSIIRAKKKNKVEDSFKKHSGFSRASNRRKGKFKNESKRISHGNGCSDNTVSSNDDKQMINLCKEKVADVRALENFKIRKKPLIRRSHSLSEKDRKQGKCRLRERPKSFGAFDSTKPVKVDHLQLQRKFDNAYVDCSYKINKESMVEKCGESENYDMILKYERSPSVDAEVMMKSKKQCDLESRRLKIQMQQNKLHSWLANIESNSVAYFIEEFKTSNCISNEMDHLSSADKINHENNGVDDFDCQFNQIEEHYCEKISKCVESSEYAEAETDSGLPSLDYESSLDTLSREDRISLEHSCDEGKTRELRTDSGFDCNSSNEKCSDAIWPIDCLNRTLDKDPFCQIKKLEKFIIERENSTKVSHLCNEDSFKEISAIKCRRSELALNSLESKRINDTENNLFEQVKYTIDKISKTDENILHCELLISQLEFQLNILSENFDAIEDIDLELEEMKIMSDLRETEEFLKAITNLSRYQREAQSEIMEDLLFIDARTKEKQMKLLSLEKRLIRQRFKFIPRHLNVSKEKRLYVGEMVSTNESTVDKISLYGIGEEAISLV